MKYFVGLILLFLVAGKINAQDFVLTGKLQGFEDNTRIILNPYLDNMDIDMDHETILLLKNGAFEFSEHLDRPTKFSLRVRPQNLDDLTGHEDLSFWSENVPMTLTGAKGEIFQSTIKGSLIQDQYFQHVTSIAKYHHQAMQITDSMKIHLNLIAGKKLDLTEKKKAEMRARLQRSFETISKKGMEFILSNPDYYSAPAELVWNITFAPDKIDTKLIQEFYTRLSPTDESNIYGKQIEIFLKRIDKAPPLSVGDYPHNFVLKNSTGDEVKFSSISANVILLDFWASGCGPCRVEHKNYVTLYNKFKSSGFEIVSVSQDQSKKQWVAAMTKDNISWTSLWDEKKEISNRLYTIPFLPTNYLIVDGKIVTTNLRGEALSARLESIFKK